MATKGGCGAALGHAEQRVHAERAPAPSRSSTSTSTPASASSAQASAKALGVSTLAGSLTRSRARQTGVGERVAARKGRVSRLDQHPQALERRARPRPRRRPCGTARSGRPAAGRPSARAAATSAGARPRSRPVGRGQRGLADLELAQLLRQRAAQPARDRAGSRLRLAERQQQQTVEACRPGGSRRSMTRPCLSSPSAACKRPTDQARRWPASSAGRGSLERPVMANRHDQGAALRQRRRLRPESPFRASRLQATRRLRRAPPGTDLLIPAPPRSWLVNVAPAGMDARRAR